MESLRKSMLCVLMIAMVTMLCTESRDPVLHRVGGGKFSWAPNVNFTEWASHEIFYVGDWLYFGFDKHRYNVLQVNFTSYVNCIDRDFIKNVTRGGRDVFNLTETKPYFFLSGGGYCFEGMKVAVYVQDSPPEPDTSYKSPHLLIHGDDALSSAAAKTLCHPNFVTMLTAASAWLWNFYT